ncbi:MAG: hypothetical protein AAFX50_12215, partial [Acidobacteriota bacterium]
MVFRRTVFLALGQLAGLLWVSPLLADRPPDPQAPGAAERLLAAVPGPGLRELGADMLDRNPEIARARRSAAAAAAKAPQVRALPDPVAALTLFALPPET